MSYASPQDLIDRFGVSELIQLTDRATPPAEAINATVIDKALTDAGGTIEAYVGRRYTLPLATVPAKLTAIACDLARYSLYENGAPEVVKDRHSQALIWLRDVAAGRAVLDIGGSEPPTGTGAVLTAAPDKLFGRASLKGF